MVLQVVGMGLFALILSACSSYPRHNMPAAGAPPPSGAVSLADGATPAIDPALIKAGYEVKNVKGQNFYCRTEVLTGSQFRRKVCLDEAQIREEQLKNREAKDTLMRQRAGPACTPMPQCAG
jgi:hypothetical protein